jgi:hypothetical protein
VTANVVNIGFAPAGLCVGPSDGEGSR